ncbi:glycosyltransferase [Limisphaera sp. 4302-co]|uniref:glycosyltransferase n=1 Tax=Limisphaera sp. 4302-co TaxID=3400417 RepID=UPI003C18A43F
MYAQPSCTRSTRWPVCFESRWEGLPTLLIDALAAVLPVVATDCPSGPRKILEGAKWGKLVPAEDCHALARGILEELKTPLLPPPGS